MVGKTFRNNGGSGTSETTSAVTPEKKEAAMEFAPHTAGKHQSVTCETVKEHTMQKLQIEPRHGLDLVKCLRDGADNGVPMTKPVRQTQAFGGQTAEEQFDQKLAQDGHDMDCQLDRKEFSVRKNTHDENVSEACAIMFGCCNRTMPVSYTHLTLPTICSV